MSKRSLLDVMKSVEAAIPDIVLEYIRAEYQLSSAFSCYDVTRITRPLMDSLNLRRYRQVAGIQQGQLLLVARDKP